MLLISDHPNLQLQLLKGHLELLLLFNQVETKFLLSLLSRDSCYYRSCYYLVVAETEQPGSILLKFQPGREFQAGSLPSILRDIKNNPKQDSKNLPLKEHNPYHPCMVYLPTFTIYIYMYINGWYGQGSTPSRLPAELPIDPLPRVHSSSACLHILKSSELMDQWGDMGQVRYGGLIGILIMVYYTPYISLG